LYLISAFIWTVCPFTVFLYRAFLARPFSLLSYRAFATRKQVWHCPLGFVADTCAVFSGVLG